MHRDDIDVAVGGRRITSGGHGFSGIARRTLLRILQARARAAGVALRFGGEVRGLVDLPALGLGDADVVGADDGVHPRRAKDPAGEVDALPDPAKRAALEASPERLLPS